MVTTSSWRARRLAHDHPLGMRLTVASVAAFLVLIPFALLAMLVVGAWPPLHDPDEAVTEALHTFALGHPGWVTASTWWTNIFAPFPLRFGVLVLVIWQLRRGDRRLALWATTTMVVGGLLGVLLKLLVGRNRPELLDPVAQAAGFSFPSGHALNAALAAGVLLLALLPFTRDRRWLRPVLWIAAIVLTVVTGATRVLLGVHFTSDVVGGWVLGIAVVAATTAGFATWREHTGRRATHTVREGVEPEAAMRS